MLLATGGGAEPYALLPEPWLPYARVGRQCEHSQRRERRRAGTRTGKQQAEAAKAEVNDVKTDVEGSGVRGS